MRQTLLEHVAGWVAALTPADVPSRLYTLADVQALSIFAAAAAGRLTSAGRAVARAVARRAPAGGDHVLVGGGSADLLTAVDAAAQWSMVQDYDDYLFMGHTGHSAVWTAYYVGAAVGADAARVRTAQVLANEVAGRLGASLVVGPHNGQLWAPIHRIGAAAATAWLLGLDARATAHAMAIALYDANDPVVRGFMGPNSKLRTASASTVAGIEAAWAAAEGLEGALDIIEHPQGFWRRFTFAPIRGTFRGLGHTWVGDTLAIKPFPGCAYVDTVVEAVRAVLAQHRERYGYDVALYDLEHVSIAAGLLTVGMDQLSRPAVAAGLLTPVVVNFSVPLSVAATLLYGHLDGTNMEAEALAADADVLQELAARVKLEHDIGYTVRLLRAVDRVSPLTDWLQALDRTGIRRARAWYGGEISRGLGGLAALRSALSHDDRTFLRQRVLWPLLKRAAAPLYGFPPAEVPFDQIDFTQLKLPFPARATLVLRSGVRLTAEVVEPPGAAGRADRSEVAMAKWMREGERLLGAAAASVPAALAAGATPGAVLALLAQAP